MSLSGEWMETQRTDDEQRVVESQQIPKDFRGTFPELAIVMTTQEAQRAAKQKYVLGFCFMHYNTEVVLIRKNKPEWQKGLLNGVGGKIEPGETPLQAMIREWHEETGSNPSPLWKHFGTMVFSGATIYVFKSHVTDRVAVYSITDEKVGIYNVGDVAISPTVIPNLKWLIPMALWDSQTDQPHWKGAPTLNYP